MKIIPCSGIVGWDITPSGIRDALREANGAPVTFEFSTPGGYIYPGLEIFNMIRNYSGETTAKLVGYAMSMGSYLPLACDRRVALDNAVYMIHNARGLAWGDHNDVLGYGAFLKGLSGVIARQYVSSTGKPMDEIVGMMDKETYFFGEEMVEHGFVHEIISGGKGDGDRDSNIAVAKACFEEAMASLSRESIQVKEDIKAAAAALNLAVEMKPPAAAGKIEKEVQQMGLKQLLADNPAAKVEFDAEIAAAKQMGEQAGKEAQATLITKVAPFLTSKEYPDTVKTTAVKVLTGETNIIALDAAVAAVDAVREQAKNEAAQEESGKQKETPPQQHKQAEPGALVSSDEDMQLAVAQFKEGGF